MDSAATISLVILAFLGSHVDCSKIHPPIPVASETPGSVYEHGGTLETGSVILEVYLGGICTDSSVSWDTLKEVLAHYGTDLTIVIHLYENSYQANSLMVAQGFYLLEEHLSQADALDFLDETMKWGGNFSNANTADKTTREITIMVADVAVDVTGVDRDFFLLNLPDYLGYTINTWKFANRRAVSGTPWYYVNGVDLTVNGNLIVTYDEWIEFLDPLFGIEDGVTTRR